MKKTSVLGGQSSIPQNCIYVYAKFAVSFPGENSLKRGYSPILHSHSACVMCKIVDICYKVDGINKIQGKLYSCFNSA